VRMQMLADADKFIRILFGKVFYLLL